MILHIDMDAFYASVEERDDPTLVGQPVVVGGSSEGRGVVCAANYEARKYGVFSAMPAAKAVRLCPNAVFLRPRMSHYAAISRQIREIFQRFTPLVEPLAFDEAFLDVTGSIRLFGPPEQIAEEIRSAIREELNLPASVGVAPNKYLAKLASDLEKPNGFVVVNPERIFEFLDPLPVTRIWGVGKKSIHRFERLKLETMGQIRQLALEDLEANFGNQAQHLWNLCRGIDTRKVVPDRVAKSISHETTFGTNIEDLETLRVWLMELTEQVASRLRRCDRTCRTVQLKVRYEDFETVTRAQKLATPSDVTREIWQAADEMLKSRLPNRRLSVRLIGVGVQNLTDTSLHQASLFDEDEHAVQSEIDRATDSIRAKFGNAAVRRGMLLKGQSEASTDDALNSSTGGQPQSERRREEPPAGHSETPRRPD